jgi:probable phosphoglycerate mutase
MTTRLYLVRHGETVLSAEDRFAGSTDVELSAHGRWQAQCLAERLSDEQITAVYSSPMKRTVDTAAIVAAPHGLSPGLHDELREIHHGRWEEMRRGDVEVTYPDEYAAWEEDPFTFAPHGGESGLSVVARALPFVRQVALAHDGQSILLVSHKATIRLLIAGLLGFDMRGYRDRLDQSPACLNVLDFRDPVHVRLMLFNDVSHYTDMPPESRARLSKWWDNRPA